MVIGWRGRLLPLAIVCSMGWLPVWMSLGGDVSAMGFWPKVLALAIPGGIVLADWYFFSQRAKQASRFRPLDGRKDKKAPSESESA